MRAHTKLITVLALAFLCVDPPSLAAAGSVQLNMRNGRMSLVATEATVSEILAEWARVGGLLILNGEKVQGGRITLELSDVTEKDALSVLLRSVSGYLAIARGQESTGASMFGRIVILPATPPPSSAIARETPPPQAVSQPPAFAFTSTPGVARIIGPNGEPVPDDQDGAPPFVPGRTPGAYSRGDEPSAAQAVPPSATKAVGTPVPGMMVPAPAPSPAPPQPRR